METRSKPPVVQPHDKFVKRMMEDSRVARDFFTAHLPKKVKEHIDLTCLIPQPIDHINDLGGESSVDVLYQTRLDGHEAYLYVILEHQSTPDELMAFRILKYTCNVIEQHLRKHKSNKIPLIYPIVMYHAKVPYPYSTDIRDSVDAPREIVDEYFLKPFQLVDLGRIADEELRQHVWAGAMELALKYIFVRDMGDPIIENADFLYQIVQIGGSKLVYIVLEYVLTNGEIRDRKAFIEEVTKQVSPEIGENIMTFAEGMRAEGMEKSKIEIVERLLVENVDLAFIARVTELPLAKIQEIQKKH